MCGIIGIHTANKMGLYAADTDAFKAMLVVNSLRGAHSTGVMGVHKKPDEQDLVDIVKVVGSPYMLFDWAKTDDFFRKAIWDYSTIVGHGRYATRGSVTVHNAHPFEEDNIVLVHNGGISNFHALADTKRHKHIDVDSHLVAKLFAEEGAENVLPTLKGAYVLVWYDTKAKTLNMARNKERPLFVAETNKESVVFASEKETLLWNAARHNMGLKGILEVTPFNIISYPVGSLTPTVTEYKEKSFFAPPAVTSVVTGKRGKLKVTDSPDRHLLQVIEHEEARTLQLGERIYTEIEDFDRMDTHILVKCLSARYPNVEFCASVNEKLKDESLIEAEQLSGVVKSIYPIERANGKDWRAFLSAPMLITKSSTGKVKPHIKLVEDKSKEEVIRNDDDWVSIPDSDGTSSRISSFRYSALLRDGCGYCAAAFTVKEAENPNSLLIESRAGKQFLVCPECKEEWCNGGNVLIGGC